MATDAVSHSSYEGDLLRVEQEVLSEKASGLSDLEVALKLLLDERTVRSILRRHLARRGNGKASGATMLTTRLLGPESGWRRSA